MSNTVSGSGDTEKNKADKLCCPSGDGVRDGYWSKLNKIYTLC